MAAAKSAPTPWGWAGLVAGGAVVYWCGGGGSDQRGVWRRDGEAGGEVGRERVRGI